MEKVTRPPLILRSRRTQYVFLKYVVVSKGVFDNSKNFGLKPFDSVQIQDGIRRARENPESRAESTGLGQKPLNQDRVRRAG